MSTEVSVRDGAPSNGALHGMAWFRVQWDVASACGSGDRWVAARVRDAPPASDDMRAEHHEHRRAGA